jgi:hypothetical protein
MRFLATAALSLLFTPPAFADDLGILVTVCVMDVAEQPIPTAVVRHPSEQDRHRVRTTDGCWEGNVLYMPNGDELVFLKGMDLMFEVSAPGYQNNRIHYTVRKRKNVAPVVLQKMEIDLSEDEDMDEPIIQFGRDKPID